MVSVKMENNRYFFLTTMMLSIHEVRDTEYIRLTCSVILILKRINNKQH